MNYFNETGGNTAFWRIDGVRPSWLLGTIHAGNWDYKKLPGELLDAFDASDIFFLETGLSGVEQTEMLSKMALNDEEELRLIIGNDRFEKLCNVAQTLGLDMVLEIVNKHNIWFTILLLTMTQASNDMPLDLALYQRGMEIEKNILYLESLTEHVSVLEKFTTEEQLEILDDTLEQGDISDRFDELLELYIKGDILGLGKYFVDTEFDYSENLKEKFINVMLKERNIHFTNRLLPYLDDNKVFTAFGAAHLLGESGVIQNIRDAGYKVEPVEISFDN